MKMHSMHNIHKTMYKYSQNKVQTNKNANNYKYLLKKVLTKQ